MKLHPFRPRLLDALKGYKRSDLLADVSAGFTVGVVALPLAMAFAIASGVKPEQGLVTAIIAGFLIAALGGSNVQIGGPAGAFIVIVYGIVERYGLTNLLISTAMAGVLLFTLGWLKLGSLVRYIPVSIIIGFTNGIAVLIGLSQIKDLLGLSIAKFPADFFAQIEVLAQHASAFNPWALGTGLLSLAVVALWPKSYAASTAPEGWLRRSQRLAAFVPGTVIVLVLATVAKQMLDLPLDTIGSRFGGIPQRLPELALPAFSWASAKQLVIPTLTIAMLGAIESLLCARVADNLMHGRKHDPNQELMAQGIANFVVPFFGGIPATGTIARTVTNVRSGARSPVAGMVHALTLLLVVLLAAPLAQHVPLAALAGILLFVAWNMGEWSQFARLRRFNLPYRTLLLGTFFFTVVFDLTVAMEVGLVLACVFFVYRMSTLFRIDPVTAPITAGAPGDVSAFGAIHTPQDLTPNVQVFSLYGSLFFAAVGKIETLGEQICAESPRHTRAVVLDLHLLVSMDSSGLDALEHLHQDLQREGVRLLLCQLNAQPLGLLQRSGFAATLGAENVFVTRAEALAACDVMSSDAPAR